MTVKGKLKTKRIINKINKVKLECVTCFALFLVENFLCSFVKECQH